MRQSVLLRALGGLAAVAVLTGAPQAAAQSPVAEALFRAGRQALEDGDFVRGCELMRESQRLEPSFGAELNLAVCEEHDGQLVRAWQRYRDVLSALSSADGRFDFAAARARALENRIARVVFKTHGPTPADARFRLDGGEFAQLFTEVPIPLDPGRHSIEVHSAGRSGVVHELELSEGQLYTLVVEGEATRVAASQNAAERSKQLAHSSPAVSSTAAASESRTIPLAVPILALGLSGAALAVSATTGLAVLQAKDDMNHECEGRSSCSQAGVDAAERGETLASIGTAAFVSGVVLGVVGVTLLVWDPKAERQSERAASFRLRIGSTAISAHYAF